MKVCLHSGHRPQRQEICKKIRYIKLKPKVLGCAMTVTADAGRKTIIFLKIQAGKIEMSKNENADLCATTECM
jgi:hypothetical protein